MPTSGRALLVGGVMQITGLLGEHCDCYLFLSARPPGEWGAQRLRAPPGFRDFGRAESTPPDLSSGAH